MKFINTTLIVFCLSFCLLTGLATAAEDENAEYKVKAGYLYNFIKFVTWPGNDVITFNVCIIGQDPFGKLIDPIEKRTAFGLPIKLFRFSTTSKTNACHIVFISSDNKADFLNKAVQQIRNAGNILLVGEGEAFAESAGMIGFVKQDGKIKLHINLKTLQQSGLMVSAKLLEVAEIVGGDSHE